jgi:general secretion pathway protein L
MRDFLRWWTSQLGELLPEGLRRFGGAAANALIIAPGGPDPADDGIEVSLRRAGRETRLGNFALSPAALGELPHDRARPTILRLGAAAILVKRLTLPLAAERDLAQVLTFEMDRETPFAADELYWSYRIAARDRHLGVLSVQLFLVPRARLARLIGALDQADLRPHLAEVVIDDERCGELVLDDDRSGPERPHRRLVIAGAAACAALALAVVTLPFAEQQRALDALDASIATQKAAASEAADLNREFAALSGSLDAVARERATTGSPLAILAAATRVLPDDAYLTELSLRQRKLTLTGRSPAAARLIGALAADGEFRDPAFAAPVTRLEALRTEVFTITAEVVP